MNKEKYTLSNEDREFLEEIIRLSNDEYTEYLSALLTLGNRSDLMSEDFLENFTKELKEQVDYVRENVHIVESEETYTHIVKDLVWD